MLFLGEGPVAVCPLIDTGKNWVGLPHFSYGGFAGMRNNDIAFNDKLVHKLIFLIQKEKVNPGFFQIDLKTISNHRVSQDRFFIRTIHKYHQCDNYSKVSSLIFLPETKEELYTHLSTNLRRKINKAANSGFDIQIGGKEFLSPFYREYSRKMHRLGSPAYGKGFFETLLETYCFGDAKIFLIMQNGEAAGAAFLLSYMGFYESSWFVTNEISYRNYVSDFLHWQIVQYAIARGASVYSFGRSTPQGSVHIYKSHWPVTDIPIYQYGHEGGNHLRNHVWLSSVWKKIPYFIAKPIGPILVKHIY